VKTISPSLRLHPCEKARFRQVYYLITSLMIADNRFRRHRDGANFSLKTGRLQKHFRNARCAHSVTPPSLSPLAHIHTHARARVNGLREAKLKVVARSRQPAAFVSPSCSSCSACHDPGKIRSSTLSRQLHLKARKALADFYKRNEKENVPARHYARRMINLKLYFFDPEERALLATSQPLPLSFLPDSCFI